MEKAGCVELPVPRPAMAISTGDEDDYIQRTVQLLVPRPSNGDFNIRSDYASG